MAMAGYEGMKGDWEGVKRGSGVGRAFFRTHGWDVVVLDMVGGWAEWRGASGSVDGRFVGPA